MDDFNYNLIDKAYNVIKEHVIKTPLVTNDYINQLLGSKVFFKLENLQKTGSFKFRGATYKLSTLSDSQKNNGVVAYSSGNHAQAVAYSSLSRNINAKIIMPSNAPKIKIENTKNYKANVVLYNPVKEIREEIGDRIAKDENRTIIPPYDDYNIIAGQGTLGKADPERSHAHPPDVRPEVGGQWSQELFPRTQERYVDDQWLLVYALETLPQRVCRKDDSKLGPKQREGILWRILSPSHGQAIHEDLRIPSRPFLRLHTGHRILHLGWNVPPRISEDRFRVNRQSPRKR